MRGRGRRSKGMSSMIPLLSLKQLSPCDFDVNSNYEFKKEFCDNAGWQLRRIDPQTYEVFNSKHEKIGIFKSGGCM
jgi:hypothetical protein